MSPWLRTMAPSIGGMAKPPKAPNPPTHPAAPPTASGTSCGTSLNTAAFPTPIPRAINISAATASPKFLEMVIRMAPASMVRSERMAVFSPPRRSDTFPPTMRITEVKIEYTAVRVPAVTTLAAKKDFQYVGSQAVMAMKPPKVVK